MELYKLEWNWIYVLLIFSYVLFVCTVSFDMIANWTDKKVKDSRILLIGSGIFALGVLLLTTNNRVSALLAVILLVTVLSGLMAVDNRFGTTKKPWELYVMAITSLVALVGITIWVYYNTSAGRYVQEKQQQVGKKYKEFKQQRAESRKRRLDALKSKSVDTYTNPLFDKQ